MAMNSFSQSRYNDEQNLRNYEDVRVNMGIRLCRGGSGAGCLWSVLAEAVQAGARMLPCRRLACGSISTCDGRVIWSRARYTWRTSEAREFSLCSLMRISIAHLPSNTRSI